MTKPDQLADLEATNAAAVTAEASRVTDRLIREQEHRAAALTDRQAERARVLASQSPEERALRAELADIERHGDEAKHFPELLEHAGLIAKRLRTFDARRELDARAIAAEVRKANEKSHVYLERTFESIDGLRMVVSTLDESNPALYTLAVGELVVHLPRIGFLTPATEGPFMEALTKERARRETMGTFTARNVRMCEVLDGPEMWRASVVLGLAGEPIMSSGGNVICDYWLQGLWSVKLLLRWGYEAERGLQGAARWTPRSDRPTAAAPLAASCFAAASYIAENRPGACSVALATKFWDAILNEPEPEERVATVRKRMSKAEAAQQPATATPNATKGAA